jgi:hypothetical protein
MHSDYFQAPKSHAVLHILHANFATFTAMIQGIPAGQTLIDQLVLHQLLLHEEAEEASTINSSTANSSTNTNSSSSSSGGTKARETSPPTRILRGSAVLDIPVRLHNYVGTFHGGAIR